VRRFALAAALAVALAGCSSGTGASGHATVWVTRDRGAHVLHVGKVPAGLTALQGLDRVAELKTRYGGRYVRAVDGVAEHGRRSWFYYVNGYLADQGSAEYRLRDGDIEWWDYRSWHDPLDDAVVVGAFPEPLLHGYGGKRRETVVVSSSRALGKRIARLVGGSVALTVPADANLVEIVAAPSGRRRFSAELRRPGAGSPVRFVLSARFASRLASDPHLARFRYAVP
jgi:Domain of unknown function (DUF4430)